MLIGRNNSGKSSVLAGLDTALSHLRRRKIASAWRVPGKVTDEFTLREATEPLEIGIQFSISKEFSSAILPRVKEEAPGLDRSVDQIAGQPSLTVLFGGALDGNHPYFYVSEVAVGRMAVGKRKLGTDGAKLFALPEAAARELFRLDREATIVEKAGVELAKFLERGLPWRYISQEKDSMRLLLRGEDVSQRTVTMLEAAVKASNSEDEFREAVRRGRTELEEEARRIKGQAISTPLTAFAGMVQSPPKYMSFIMEQLGAPKVIHFREVRPAISEEDAAQLLRLKTKRGGTERLETIQKTVKALLGVRVDAFESELAVSGSARRSAEIDVDDFLVEANGAGIREALRIVLDIELKEPALALIEEPEVHLHPGLERSLHTYLSSKRDAVQMFVATHSTSFIDVSEGQSIYILSRNDKGLTAVEQVLGDAQRLRIPEEVGLKPSTVFMFDKLVFVEGVSDELILREFANTLGIDLVRENVAFVHMGGANNFANFAADATLALLSRRRIPMWFFLDKDERDEADISKIRSRLGTQAHLVGLNRRELENYLLDSSAIVGALKGRPGITLVPTVADVERNITDAVEQQKKRTVELRMNAKLLTPIYPHRLDGSVQERLDATITELESRKSKLADLQAQIAKDVESRWQYDNLKMVSGSRVLETTFSKLKLKYSKMSDGPRIAAEMAAARIDQQIADFLKQLAREETKRDGLRR